MRTFLFKRNFSGRKYVLLTTVLCLLSVAAGGGFTTAFLMAADSNEAEVVALEKETDTKSKEADAAVGKMEPYKTAIDGAKSDKAADETLTKWSALLPKLKGSKEDFTKLNTAGTDLGTIDGKITLLIKKLDDLKKPAETDKLKERLANIQKVVKEKITSVNSTNEGLKKSLDAFYAASETAGKELAKQTKALTDIPGDSAPDILIKNIKKLVTDFKESGNIGLQAKFLEKWTAVDTELKNITAAPPAAKPTETIQGGFDSTVAVIKKLIVVSGKLADFSSTTQDALLEMRIKLDQDIQKHGVAGTKLLKVSEDQDTDLNSILADLKAMSDQLTKIAKYPQEIRDGMPTAMAGLSERLEKFPRALSMVREGLAGNFEDFVADFVPLYNFSDVRNLIRILNPEMREVRDVSAFREEAKTARENLEKSDQKVVLARGFLAEIQTRVDDLEEELKLAETRFESSSLRLTQQKRLIDELEGRSNPDTGRIKRAKQRQEDLEKENTDDKAKFDELNNKDTGLKPQIKAAREKMVEAQKQLRQDRSEMIQLAQIESEAFAQARDNEQVFFALNNVLSRDPVKQVIIYGFASRKVIFLRGKKGDIDRAKDVISLFDRPAPQARVTLRTLEINSTADKEGARKVNEALDLVENQLSNSRTKVAAAMSFLRDCINEEVNGIAIGKLAELERARKTPTVRGHESLIPNDAEDMRWARLFFYQTEVLMRLGFDPEIKNAQDSRNQTRAINRFALPDPAGTTTIGEAMVILSLANPASRYEILKKFTTEISAKLDELGLCAGCEKEQCGARNVGGLVWFPSTKRALGADFEPYYKYPQINPDQLRDGRALPNPPTYPPTYAFTSMQKEIVGAITKATVPRLLSRMIRLRILLPKIKGAAADNVNQEITDILKFLWDALGISSTELSPAAFTTKKVDGVSTVNFDDNDLHKLSAQYAEIAKNANILRTANAQVARADLMLKQLIDAFSEDMDRHFIRPMVSCLRTTLNKKKGIGVGVMTETSVLATNRLVARVDPRASAQLSIGDTQDALQAAQQLASLYTAAQTGGILGGFAGLGGLQQKDTSEIYGLTSGNLFKVNPIFDPTGQTLRFQFDYVGANLVTDPDGSTNPQLPRIERHTVNTEVQLNNFELREISRFESNARLGIATQYRGGFPIIKDIPYVKYIPLIGWFTRRAGKSAVVQQSLMLGQTTMYPTIADIFDLLNGDDYYFYSDLEEWEKNSPATTEGTVGTPTPTPIPSPAPAPSIAVSVSVALGMNTDPPTTPTPAPSPTPTPRPTPPPNLNVVPRPNPNPSPCLRSRRCGTEKN